MGQFAVNKNPTVFRKRIALLYDLKANGTSIDPTKLEILMSMPDYRLAIIVFVGTLGAFTLFVQGVSMVGPVTAALLACLEPLTAALLSAVWLGSVFTAAELIGFACILSTVFLLSREV